MHDHVDFVVGQWSRAMPELDASSMKIFGRMLRLMKHLGKERAQAMGQFGFARASLTCSPRCVAPVSRTAFPPRSSINRCW